MFLYSNWVRLPFETRVKIASVFGIKKTKATHVSDSVVVEDGYAIQDVEAGLSTDSLKAFTGLKENDTNLLWTAMVEKVNNNDLSFPVEVPVQEIITPEVTLEKPTKNAKTKAKAKK